VPKLPPRARYELIQAVIRAFDSPTRQKLMGHLFEAGKDGLRTSDLARLTGERADTVRKALQVLEQALLVANQVGRDESGVFSRYVITDYGDEWFDRKMGLAEGRRALPLVAEA